MDEIGTLVKQEMLNRAPQETGTMRMSIEKKVGDHSVEVGTNGIPYAKYIEYGTVDIQVGIPEMPRLEWEALIKRNEVGTGQTMPFARSADFFTRNQQKEIFGKVFHK